MYYYQTKYKRLVANGDQQREKVFTALILADDFSQAESLAQERMDATEVISIGRMDKVREVFGPNTLKDGYVFYVVNVVAAYVMEGSGKEKKVRYKVIVQATAPSLAARYVEDTMNEGQYNMTVEAVNEAKFCQIIEP